MSAEMKTTTRLRGEEAAFVERLRLDTDEATALRELTGRNGNAAALTTLTGLINAVIDAGIAAIKERAVDVGYRRLAEHEANDPEAQVWRSYRRERHMRPHPDGGTV
jgi:hypothetical protein